MSAPNKQRRETRKPTWLHNTRGKPTRWYNTSKPKEWSNVNSAKRKIEGDAKAVQKDGFGKHAKVVINNNEAREGENPVTKIDEKEENKKGKNLEMPSDATDDPETTNDEESLEAMSDSEWESGWV